VEYEIRRLDSSGRRSVAFVPRAQRPRLGLRNQSTNSTPEIFFCCPLVVELIH
jgi:hypothetical protein